jgi:hypothetical protein
VIEMTHQIIRVIVYAKTESEAIDKARKNLERLCDEDNGPFDYFQMFGTYDDTSPVCGTARWGKMPTILLAHSKEGKKLITEGAKRTKAEFMRNIYQLRRYIETHTDEELYLERVERPNECMKCDTIIEMDKPRDYDKGKVSYPHWFFKAIASWTGTYRGSQVWLYDNDCEGIRTPYELNNVMTKYRSLYEDNDSIEGPKPNPYKDDLIWVCPADVHH